MKNQIIKLIGCLTLLEIGFLMVERGMRWGDTIFILYINGMILIAVSVILSAYLLCTFKR